MNLLSVRFRACEPVQRRVVRAGPQSDDEQSDDADGYHE